jgi:hypothetical protein
LRLRIDLNDGSVLVGGDNGIGERFQKVRGKQDSSQGFG